MKEYETWIEYAESALKVALEVKSTEGIRIDDKCYLLQQAVEKVLKALLIYYNEKPPKIHNIQVLFSHLKPNTDIPKYIQARTLCELTDFAIQKRYPGEYIEGISNEKYHQYIDLTRLCFDWVRNTVNKKIENNK